MKEKKNEDIGFYYIIFDPGSYGSLAISVDKSAVLMDARAFNETPLNPARCRLIISKLIVLLYHSIPLTPVEATDIFFNITKLFMSNNVPLRQMVYLAIKELAPIANDVIMVTSSLTKDMNSKSDTIYRPNAIRALCKITDASFIQGIERFIKQSIVDKIPAVSSAAIVCSFHLYQLNKEVVKRWNNEVQEAINSKGIITQYHAVSLLHLIKHNDRMAIIKLIQNCNKMNLRSPYANCMLIRFICKIIDEEPDSKSRPMFDLLQAYLRHKSEMVVFEAAKSICGLKNVTTSELTFAISALQLLLVSHKPTLRFAATRTLNKLALTHPTSLWSCNPDLENLVTDPNRSIAIFSITTLLKTGTEASVDRLMKQINTFMSEISDEFKVIIIDAVRTLCLKFPKKQATMLNFLSTTLRDEGGYEYKKAITEAFFDIIHNIPECIDTALAHLCEFIEDCEYTKIAVRILHLIGSEGSRTKEPTQYIRFVYNRVVLENSAVRSAAVSALAKFAVAVPSLRPRLTVLLNRCLDDIDDEVRDRAAMYLKIIEQKDLAEKYISNDSTYSLAALENSLGAYLSNKSIHTHHFDISTVPTISKAQSQADQLKQKAIAQESIAHVTKTAEVVPDSDATFDDESTNRKNMEKIPSLAALGSLIKSSKVVELTENDVEYVVHCIKHIFPQHFVFQFNIKNTIQGSLLENVTVQMRQTEKATMKPCFVLPILKCEFNKIVTGYVVFERQDFPTVSFSNTLNFCVKEVDEEGQVEEEGYQDQYVVEDLDIEIGDYINPLYNDITKLFEELEHEVVETYSLGAVNSIKVATDNIISVLNMNVHNDSGNVGPKATVHTLLLSGTFVGNIKVAVKCRMALDSTSGVTLEVTVKSSEYEIADLIANSIC